MNFFIVINIVTHRSSFGRASRHIYVQKKTEVNHIRLLLLSAVIIIIIVTIMVNIDS